jgi:hypothetical protein
MVVGKRETEEKGGGTGNLIKVMITLLETVKKTEPNPGGYSSPTGRLI